MYREWNRAGEELQLVGRGGEPDPGAQMLPGLSPVSGPVCWARRPAPSTSFWQDLALLFQHHLLQDEWNLTISDLKQ